MEESKELQGLYTIFRATIYISLLLEFFMYALDPTSLDFLGGLITNIHSRLQLLSVYQFLPYSKMVTVMLVIITCIGTKNKKQLEFDARKMVFWPITLGLLFVILVSIHLQLGLAQQDMASQGQCLAIYALLPHRCSCHTCCLG